MAAPTVEFRLPDGSALPHLLLAGVAQAMVEGRNTPNLDELLEQTSTQRSGRAGGAVNRVPWNAIEVADALVEHRDTLIAGEIFPEVLVDRLVEQLKG